MSVVARTELNLAFHEIIRKNKQFCGNSDLFFFFYVDRKADHMNRHL